MVNHIKAMKDCILEQNIKKKKNKTKIKKKGPGVLLQQLLVVL